MKIKNFFYLPTKSFLIIKGNLTKNDITLLADTDAITSVNNTMMFLFDRFPHLNIFQILNQRLILKMKIKSFSNIVYLMDCL